MGMDRAGIKEGLEDAGLSEYQAQAYLTLLERGTSAAVDVAKNSSIPVPRIYDVLNELEQMGYVETLDRDTLHARACDPVAFIEDLHQKSDRLSEVAGEIEDRWEQSPLGEHEVNVSKHAKTVFDHAEEAIRNADSAVDVALTERQLTEFESAVATAVDDDVFVRASVYREKRDSSTTGDHPVADVVTELRERSVPAPFLAVVDRTKVCLAPTTRMPDPYGVVVNDDIVSFAFQWYFETCLWAVWETVSQRPTDPLQYVCLEEFIYDVYPFWRDDAVVSLTTEGVDTTSGEAREVAGVLTDVSYTGQRPTDARPSLAQLSGRASVDVQTGDRRCTIGGWGAQLEDIEARRITVDAIEWAG